MSSSDAGDDVAREPEEQRRVGQLVDEFLDRLLAGESPDSSDLILDHPDLAAELEWRLELVEQARQLLSRQGCCG